MFDEHMQIRDGEKLFPLHLLVRGSEPLPMVFQLWMAEVARDHLRLGVYFRAVGIMLQVPGAPEYAWVDDDSETWDLIKETDENALLNVLAECFARLGVKQLIEQVPGPDYDEEELPEEWTDLLNKLAGVKNGLLNVVAECLDALVVGPGMAEINGAVEQPWWLRWPVHNM